ncbi:alkylated DNA repair protein [Bernardetia litoralis DSM 6794]|uniref:Alkylated DNA repair protein n=2 Tax=Bernardetia litoralis TaxID=999 RepID=I4AJS0_BERLS|nr:alpha-ketoglutarate-dependent dioxygenase AlkB [Bernardetia litoralis]AFM04205.1 alkylated DNA repair protein [Bernardetia litoralis DSM 6794]
MNLFDDNIQLPFSLPKEIVNSYCFDKELNGFIISIQNGYLFYSPNFFSTEIGNRFMSYLLASNTHEWNKENWRETNPSEVSWTNIDWRHDKIKMFGKTVLLPRFSAWYGDKDSSYTYSGLNLQPNEWNDGLLYIKNKIEEVAQAKFNSVLLNWYRDGQDYISWHTDSEKDLGINPVIASANFGVTRRFVLRRIDDHSIKFEIPLPHGSLLIMKEDLQHFWQHQVPKESKVKGTRINLTFRNIL